jgi:hypothetical protein
MRGAVTEEPKKSRRTHVRKEGSKEIMTERAEGGNKEITIVTQDQNPLIRT